MQDISIYMCNDHRRCDELFAAAERCVAERDWSGADLAYMAFREALAQHMALEENILFISFEQRTGNTGGTGGPTAVMRMEHDRLRDLADAMARALEYRQQDEYLGHAETLQVMLAQHNMKEENILYPLSDRILADDAVEILDEMRAYDFTEAS